MKINKQASNAIVLGLAASLVAGCVPAAVVGSSIVGKAAIEDRSLGTSLDDTSTWGRIKKAYMNEKDNNILGSRITIKVREGKVLLTGIVPHLHDKIRAIKLAWQQVGVAEVRSEVRVEGISATNSGIATVASDSWITTQIKTKLLAEKNLRSVNYSIETIDHTVYVFGKARSQHELDRVLDVAGRVKDVKEVVSHVSLGAN